MEGVSKSKSVGDVPEALHDVIADLRVFLLPILDRLVKGLDSPLTWTPDDGMVEPLTRAGR